MEYNEPAEAALCPRRASASACSLACKASNVAICAAVSASSSAAKASSSSSSSLSSLLNRESSAPLSLPWWFSSSSSRRMQSTQIRPHHKTFPNQNHSLKVHKQNQRMQSTQIRSHHKTFPNQNHSQKVHKQNQSQNVQKTDIRASGVTATKKNMNLHECDWSTTSI